MSKIPGFQSRQRQDGLRRALCSLLLLAGATTSSVAAPRVVAVDGQPLSPMAMQVASQLNCGGPVAPGKYWVDLNRREWGILGQPGRLALPYCVDQARAFSPPRTSVMMADRTCPRGSTFDERLRRCQSAGPAQSGLLVRSSLQQPR